MKTIWFQGKYVQPIMDGSKTHTVRARCKWKVGEKVQATVGPRPAFAILLITDIKPVALSTFPTPDQAELSILYPGIVSLFQIDFERVCVRQLSPALQAAHR